MFSGEARRLLEAHIECQLGCYLSEVVEGPGSSRYLAAAEIPDVGWNFCIPGTGTKIEVDWGVAQARLHGRDAAFLVPNARDLESLEVTEASPERWMMRPAGPVPLVNKPTLVTRVETVETADPGGDFATVFGRLFHDEDLNSHFRRYYGPTLRAAAAPLQAKPIHLVAYAGADPVACASIYLLDDLAGLYNVGTVAALQGRGVGAWLSCEALKSAAGMPVFLQCEVGNHVERLYKGVGFSEVFTPEIVTGGSKNG